MASMARQIRLRSRMVAGFDGESGHAFAEFLAPVNDLKNNRLQGVAYRTDTSGIWLRLDWFKDEKQNKYTYNMKIFEDI
jgi:tRNA A37 methylthiotransferase MiaB